jgi:hypothetical protein
MTRAHYGMIAGIAGAAFAAWWMRRRGRSVAGPMSTASSHGEVIYSNSPIA